MEEHNEVQIPYTPEWLIAKFGDEAYMRGVELALDALKRGDKVLCRALGAANIELIRRGYNKMPEGKAG